MVCNCMNAYCFVKAEVIITGQESDAAASATYGTGKSIRFKNCTPFANCMTEINNTKTDNPKDLDVLMLIYYLLECRGNYAKTRGS